MGTNICLKSKNLHQLQRSYEMAKDAGLLCELIIDEHHIMPPHFNGKPIITCLGLGPAKRSDIDFITNRFNLLK